MSNNDNYNNVNDNYNNVNDNYNNVNNNNNYNNVNNNKHGFDRTHGDWSCPQCNFCNFETRSICRECGYAKPHEMNNNNYNNRGGDYRQRVSNGSWKCPKCNCNNPYLATKCHTGCGYAKFGGGYNANRNYNNNNNNNRGGYNRNKRNWKCPKCNCSNSFYFNFICRGCGYTKPNDMNDNNRRFGSGYNENKNYDNNNNNNFNIWEWNKTDTINPSEGSNYDWCAYPDDICVIIDSLQVFGSFQCNINGNIYIIKKSSPTQATQENVLTKTKRDIRKKPNGYINNQQNENKNDEKIDILQAKFDYPSFWKKSQPGSSNQYDKVKIFKMNKNDNNIKNIFSRWEKYMPTHYQIVSIECIQNKRLFQKYALEKCFFSDQLNEKTLYHSTTESAIKSIIHTGFRNEFSSRAVYGQGTYFGVTPYVSHTYAKEQHGKYYKMLVCNVITGQSAQGNSSFVLQKWPKKKKNELYDSLVDDPNKPSIFVIHENRRAYAHFIISYQYSDMVDAW